MTDHEAVENVGTTGRDRAKIRRARTASWSAFSGQTLEYYDFNLYGTSSALVFGALFFPTGNAVVSTMIAFASFAVGFLARPLGGIIFGHIGDRFGRKGALVVTLLIMGISTTAIGVLPTFETVGLFAPVMLVALRLVQGLALGGEWGGAALVAIEHAPKRERAFYGSIPQLGSPAGLLLSTAVILLMQLLPDEAFLAWGWRMPFLFSAVLLAIAMYIRSRVEETPDFQQRTTSRSAQRLPIVEVFRVAPRALIFGVMAVLVSSGGYYLINTFTVTYVVDELGLDSSIGLNAQIFNAVAQGVVLLGVGVLGTKRSPRRIVAIAGLATAGWAFPLYWLMQLGAEPAIYFGLIVATLITTAIWALIPTLLASQFPAHVRYTGISLVYQGGTSIGGMSPLVATGLLSLFGGSPWPLAVMLAIIALITATGAFGLREVRAEDVD